MARLGEEDRAKALTQLAGWTYDEGRSALSRSFRFADFNEAFAFMTRVALAAEKADHHPDWSNSWNRVEIRLTTHNEGGVTTKDVDLARRIEEIAKGASA